MKRKISQSELKAMEKEGLTVRRKLGAQPSKPKAKVEDLPEKPPTQDKEPLKAEVPHASMAASMDATAAEREAMRVLVAKNIEVIEGFKADLAKQRQPGGEYTFDIKRDEDKLLKRIHVRPGIIED